MDAAGNPRGDVPDYKVWGVAFLAVLAALAAFAGVQFDVTARTGALLTTIGAASPPSIRRRGRHPGLGGDRLGAGRRSSVGRAAVL